MLSYLILCNISLLLLFHTTISIRPHCISIEGPHSGTNEGALSQSTCTDSYSMISCGIRASNSTETDIDGSFITQNSTGHMICNARNAANSPNGVHSIARCCNITEYVECNTYASTISPPFDNSSHTISCPSSNEQLTGCTVHTEGIIHGSYPGVSIYNTTNHCTTKLDINSNIGLYSEATCCAPKHQSISLYCYRITNHSIFSNTVYVECPCGYFMSGCSALSSNTPNQWEIDDINTNTTDRCIARQAESVPLTASAICCQFPTYFDCRSTYCNYRSMVCEDDRDCVVDCGYDNNDGKPFNDEACQYALIVCGANAKCEVLCDADESCEYTAVDATRATRLIIRCNDYTEACASTRIFCPIHGECSVIADNNKRILNGFDIFTVNGLNNVQLNSTNVLQSDVEIRCGSKYQYSCLVTATAPHDECQNGVDNDKECESVLALDPIFETKQSHFDCRSKQCKYQTLVCVDDTDCTIDCGYDDGDNDPEDDEACANSLVICPQGAKCDVFCDGAESCQFMKIYATASTALNITCFDHYESCFNIDIVCPHSAVGGKCHITGYNEQYDVFQEMKILALNGMEDVVFTNSSSLQSAIRCYSGVRYEYECDLYNIFDCRSKRCYNKIICHDDADCTIDCSNTDRACQRTDIYCPLNHKCVVHCGGAQSCEYITFYAADSTQLDIICDAHSESCKDTHIYCPESCGITGYNGTFVYRMEIYAINGVNDVTFALRQSASLPNGIIVYCGSEYEYSCKLESIAPFKRCQMGGTNDAICDFIPTAAPIVPTLFPSTNPTIASTSLPSLFPTRNPTSSPSENPTLLPSINPILTPSKNPSSTLLPSLNPTLFPSVNPTVFPSLNPSSFPSLNPTLFPSVNPTANPSSIPTLNPSVNPMPRLSIPTVKAPTNKPFNDGEVVEATDTTHNAYDSAEDDQKIGFIFEKYWLLLLMIAILCIILCGVYIVYLRRKMAERMDRQIVHNLENVDSDVMTTDDHHMDGGITADTVTNTVQMVTPMTPTSAEDSESEYRKKERDRSNKLTLKAWFDDTVDLAQYYDVFIQNGYESLAFVKEIDERSELKEMGIDKVAHQKRIMKAIDKLKEEHLYCTASAESPGRKESVTQSVVANKEGVEHDEIIVGDDETDTAGNTVK